MNRNSGTYSVTEHKMSSNIQVVSPAPAASWMAAPMNHAPAGHISSRSTVPPGGHASRSRAPHNQKVRRNRTKTHRSPAPLPGPWRDSGGWTQSFASNKPSPIHTQDISPGFAQRKVVLLAEKRKFADASQLLNQLNVVTLKAVFTNLPMRLFVESIPESLILLESIYSRLFIISADDFPVEELLVEGLVFHIVRYMAMRDSLRDITNPTPEEAMKSVTTILRIVLYVNPELIRTLYSRKKLMESSLKGIGEHSMISMKGQLMNLHDALKDEFDNTILQYKTALQKLEVLNLSKAKPVTSRSFRKKKPSEGNHQELMKLTRDQIQERLYKNKTILNAVEASLYNRLPKLLQLLQDRIEFDKNALLAFGRLQKEITSIPANTKVAPVIAQYTKGLKIVLDIFRDLLDVHGSETSSNLGYATDEQEEEQVIQLEEVDDVDDVAIPGQDGGSGSTPPSQQVTTEADSDGDSKTNGHVSLRDRPPHHAPSQRRIRQQQEQQQTRRSRSEERKGWRGGSRGRSKERARSRSVDRSAISRPRRDSVNDSTQFQQMMKRINKVSASSPVEATKENNESISYSSDEPGTPTSKRSSETDALLREERGMRQTLEKERHRLLMRERELVAQVDQLKRELTRAKKETERLQYKQREDKLVRRSSINSTHSNASETPIFIKDAPPSLPAPKPVRYSIGDLLYEYDKLYTEERAEAWAVLPDITDVDDFEENHEKKDRLLFSCIELSFGTAQTYLHQIMTGDRPVKAEGASGLGDEALLQFLQRLGDNFEITDMITDVQTLVKHAAGNMEIPQPMVYFSNHCVKLAWKLTIQTPPYVIDASSRSFDSIKHQRAPGSDRKNPQIKKHIWPCLLESDSLQCVYKGVVVT